MQTTTGAVRQSGLSQPADTQSASRGKFNSTLINGLKKSGNGVVVKVPAGVKSINIRPMNAPLTKSSVDLGRAEPIKVTFNNLARDNFITLRVDADGQIHATVVDDLSAAIELDGKMSKQHSKVGIVDGDNRLLNETKSLRIRESIDGKFNTGNIRFLSAVQLTEVSSRLSTFFKKFRHMTESSGVKDLSIIKKFKPVRRKGKDQKHPRHRRDEKDQSNNQDDFNHPGRKSLSKHAVRAKTAMVQIALLETKRKIEKTKAQLAQVTGNVEGKKSRGKSQRLHKKTIAKLKEKITNLERGYWLITEEKGLDRKDTLECNKLLVGLFMDEKKRLFRKFKQINKQKNSFKDQTYANFASDLDNIEESINDLTEIEQTLLHYESKKEQAQEDIRVVNDLIRAHGGYRVLTPPPTAEL